MVAPLASERCDACRPDSPHVTAAERATLTPQIPDWEEIEVKGEPRLRRTYRLPSWEASLALTLRIGEQASQQDHHPTITTSWGKVTVTWWTHAIHGLHRNDFIMAAQSDEAFAQLTA